MIYFLGNCALAYVKNVRQNEKFQKPGSKGVAVVY